VDSTEGFDTGEGQNEGRVRGDAVERWYRGEGQEGRDTVGRGSMRRGHGGGSRDMVPRGETGGLNTEGRGGTRRRQGGAEGI